MTIQLDHTIVAARDKEAAALFLSEILGLPAPLILGPFAVVKCGETSLDFMDTGDPINSQHSAFRVSEQEFDDIFTRIQARGLAYWADPGKSQEGRINCWDDGRGVYFDSPDGHFYEIITRSYGSQGTDANQPHPLVAHRLDPRDVHDVGGKPEVKRAGHLASSECPDSTGS